jgi:hypothetical protein
MLSEEIKLFVERYADYERKKESETESSEEKIHVDEIASKLAVFYEKIRNIIDYRDAHLLRKNAIGRILHRRIFLKDFNKDFAEPLIKELIRSGHLQNDTIPESKIADVQNIIDNLLVLLKAERATSDEERSEVSEWLIQMSISMIEDELFESQDVASFSDVMYLTIKKNLITKNIPLTEDEINLQLFIAVQKSLFRPDENQLKYSLLKIMYPSWNVPINSDVESALNDLKSLKTKIDSVLKNPYGHYFLKLCNREKITFQLIGDMVFDGVPLDEDFESSLKFRYDKRFLRIKKQLRRIAFLSVISFLISKMLIAFAIEIPLDKYIYHAISISSLLINISFPPLLMLFIVSFIKLPSKKNFFLVYDSVKQIIYSEDEKKYIISAPKNKSILTNIFIYLVYGGVLIITLYFVTKWLLYFHFSPASIVIFILFSSMVIATGVKIKNRAREMSLEKETTNVFGFIIDLITVPFMIIGRWTISGLSKFNILVVVFDFLIELPFQVFVEFVENFRSFLRDRKEEIN